MMSTVFKIATAAMVCAISMNAFALCSANDVTVNFDHNIVVQRDAPVGTVLATLTTRNPIKCDPEGQQIGYDGSWFIQLSGANADYGASPLANVRATVVPGIGIRWKNFSSTTGTSEFVSRMKLNNASWRRGILQNGVSTFTDTFELIKTSTTPLTGSIPALTLNMEYSTPVSNNIQRLPLYKYIFSPMNISTASCQIEDKNLNINMGIALLPKFNGVGSTQNSVTFSIPLICSEQTAVNVTLDNVSPLADPANGVLGLNSNSTAKGLGIQLKYNDAPVQFGKLIKYGTAASPGEVVNIPFKAAYYMTSANAQSGSVSATASFTMTYR
ncbi:fimbrial protein [Enterobacter cancerogenus]|uniref:fimbrial protein n=1 Tax=Enterobacter cancerogenus TaxID=69218 RepID=UPI001FCB199C|nr:fimbrial protein [Enterobacter cancerogenus]